MTITPRTRCFMHMAPLLKLSDSPVKTGNIERGTAKVHGRKEKTGKVQLRYIEDIHVIDVFFVGHTMKFLGICTRLVGMKCHAMQHNTRIQWPK